MFILFDICNAKFRSRELILRKIFDGNLSPVQILTTAGDQVIFTRVNLCEKLVDHLRNISTKSQTSLKNYGILL